ncbi:MAG: class I SAM-dependent methyltransferase [Phycisphaerae bacterium]|jgi:SAM-dependent methyltransferase
MSNQRLEDALQRMKSSFPVQGYIKDDRIDHWRFMADLVCRHVSEGERVMDFGCGPGDFPWLLAQLGRDSWAGDDLQDPWHLKPGMHDTLKKYMGDAGVKFSLLEHDKPFPWPKNHFKMVMSHHTFEHIPESPKGLLEALVDLVAEDGLLLITVPSAVNIRKRLDVMRGRTNYPPYDQFYWLPSPWRGHRREYCRDDLAKMAQYLNLEVVELRAYTCMLARVPPSLRGVYKLVVSIFPDWQDSWILLARKPKGWKPLSLPPDERTFKSALRGVNPTAQE